MTGTATGTVNDAEARLRALLDQGQTFFAYDFAQRARKQFPNSVPIAQGLALALMRAGAPDDAQQVLEELSAQSEPGARDEETQGLQARIARDRWERTGQEGDARRARDAYRDGFRASGGGWTGINAATLSWIIGDHAQAMQLSRDVLAALRTQPEPEEAAARYWRAATEAEALLLLGNPDAGSRYAEAAKIAGQRHGLLAASRRQLLRLQAHGFPVPPAIFTRLKPPTVVVFTGHMLDRRDRPQPRFPASMEERVRGEIRRHLDALDAQVGFSAAACGADLLFLEEIKARGGETHIILPYADEDFVATSVAFAGRAWESRFHRAMAEADTVRCVTEESVPEDEAVFALMDRMLLGYAALSASAVDAAPTLLAVWDGVINGLSGGTGEMVSRWPSALPRRVIPLSAAPMPLPDRDALAPAPSALPEPFSRQFKTLLFADVVGYSRIQENRTPAFMRHFLQRIAEDLPQSPLFLNTWGDALFVIMDNATLLAEYALTLQEIVCGTDWAAFGLPSEMSIRIGLHAGPVYEGINPLTGTTTFYGSHVNRAARLESVTVPRQVYATEQFAALLTAEQLVQGAVPPPFACHYLGKLALAKNYGPQPAYLLHRTGQ